MEAERVVYTSRRSTTTKIMRRTSSQQQDNITLATEVGDHQSQSSQSPGNQVSVDNGIGTAKTERMFSSSSKGRANNNSSSSPTATVVTRQNSGQLKQTQSDSKHHYQPQLHLPNLEHQQQQQLNYNNSQQQQQQSQKQLRRLLIHEPQIQQQQQSPANIRLNINNYGGNEICSNARTNHHNNHHQQQQQQQQQQRMQTSKPIQQQQQQQQQQRYYHQRSDFPQQHQSFDTAAVKQARQNHQYSDYYHYCDSSQYTNPTISPKSSSMINSSSNNNNNNNNYNDNILLFATEHNNNNQQQQQQQQLLQSQSPAQVVQQEPPTVSSGSREQKLSNNMSSSFSSPSVARLTTNTGRFVNYYPSWRQTQSPPTCNSNQYSFHVPFDSSTNTAMEKQRYRQQLQRQQARYGFVAPANRIIYNNSRRRFDHSFRSQTISHLPSMVKVTCLETIGTPEKQQQQQLKSSLKQRQQQQTDPLEDHRSSASRFGYENIDYGSSNYIPAIVTDNYDDNNHRSESNLLQSTTRQASRGSERERNDLDVHRVPTSGEYGFDNPFKPGTELSWEADMMVKLMARGYPIEELPQLIEAAKQVARERSHHDNTEQQTITKKSINTNTTRQQQGNNFRVQGNIANKNKSSDDLISDWSAGKQVWANSLSRAKSMPRKLNTIPSDAAYITNAATVATDSKDNDSIDKLIADIENEMSELLGLDGFNQQEKKQKSRTLPISQSEEPLSTMFSTSAESKTVSKSGSKLLFRNNNDNDNSSRMPKTTSKTNRNNKNNKKQQEVINTKRNRTTITRANNNNKFNDLIDNDDDDNDVIDYSGDRQRIEPSRNQVIMKKSRSECCKIH